VYIISLLVISGSVDMMVRGTRRSLYQIVPLKWTTIW